MPFIPHTSEDTSAMLDFLGIPSIDRLFDEIPDNIRAKSLSGLPEGIGEMALMQLMESRARQDEGYACFIGAGAYEHHIPAAVWDIVSRGEFLTAYTPYQAEASQGTLQLIYEFQSMMAHLTAMDVANASVYDGASALAEAVLMAVRSNKKSSSRRVLCAGNLHPSYISACDSIVSNQEIELVSLGWNRETGTIDSALLAPHEKEDYAALIVSNPSFFGTLEDVNQLTDWAHARDILVIAVVNPTSLALLVPPGHWGSGSDAGADIAVGEGQPLGIPLASGGPYLGFMCCKQALVRQMPGRIIGRTEDIEGHTGYALTLQAREQHIRRAKATSNICTNQGLLVTAATIYMSLMGASGLKAVAADCHNGLRRLVEQVTAIPGVTERFQSPCFHEAVLQLPVNAQAVLQEMQKDRILGGLALSEIDEDLANSLLVNVTETKSEADIETYRQSLNRAIRTLQGQESVC